MLYKKVVMQVDNTTRRLEIYTDILRDGSVKIQVIHSSNGSSVPLSYHIDNLEVATTFVLDLISRSYDQQQYKIIDEEEWKQEYVNN